MELKKKKKVWAETLNKCKTMFTKKKKEKRKKIQNSAVQEEKWNGHWL